MASVDIILIYFNSIIEILVELIAFFGGFVIIYSILSLFLTILIALIKTFKLIGVNNGK